MYKLYGKDRTEEEMKAFLKEHLEGIKKDKRSRYNKILELIAPGNGNFLDYGCGWGHYAIEAAAKGYNVTGIDLSDNEINICKMMYPESDKLKFEVRSIKDLPSNSYDLVLSSQVIEHVHNCGNYLNEINRVLKPGGKLIITTPNIVAPRFAFSLLSPKLENNLVAISKKINSEYDKGVDHINGWDPIHFTRLVSTVGFTLLKFIPAEGVPFPMRKPFKPYMYFTGRFKNLCYTMIFEFEKITDSKIGIND